MLPAVSRSNALQVSQQQPPTQSPTRSDNLTSDDAVDTAAPQGGGEGVQVEIRSQAAVASAAQVVSGAGDSQSNDASENSTQSPTVQGSATEFQAQSSQLRQPSSQGGGADETVVSSENEQPSGSSGVEARAAQTYTQQSGAANDRGSALDVVV